MAMLTRYNKINPYIKLGEERDFCIICAMKKGVTPDRDLYETQRSLQGKLNNEYIIHLKQRGFSQCICMNCVKEIALKYTDLVEPVENTKDTEVASEDSEKKSTKKDTKKNKEK